MVLVVMAKCLNPSAKHSFYETKEFLSCSDSINVMNVARYVLPVVAGVLVGCGSQGVQTRPYTHERSTVPDQEPLAEKTLLLGTWMDYRIAHSPSQRDTVLEESGNASEGGLEKATKRSRPVVICYRGSMLRPKTESEDDGAVESEALNELLKLPSAYESEKALERAMRELYKNKDKKE